MRSRAHPVTVVLLIFVLAAEAAAPPLTAAPALAALYRQILDANPDLGPTMRAACAEAPPEACRVLAAAGLWWQIQLDRASVSLDGQFLSAVNSAIDATEAWVAREPRRAESWFYLGAAYGARVQWRALRGQLLAAARDGKRIKGALDRAVELDPTLDDAFFGLGLYQYYAAVAPTAAKILRFLLLLPGGDRQTGLNHMMRARERGALLRGEADYQLAIIYLWYEKQPGRALELFERLRAEYPRNPVFVREIARVQDVYLHDAPSSLDTYRALLSGAQQKRVNGWAGAVGDARLGIARQLDALCETDRAIEQLSTLIDAHPREPVGILARAHLQRGAAYDRLGRRSLATAEYRAAIQAADGDPYDVVRAARTALRLTPDARMSEAYRLSLEGWRQLEAQRLTEAESSLTRSIAINPSDPVARYRHGRLLLAQQRTDAALAEFRKAIAMRSTAPPAFAASSYLDAARLVERNGARAEAIALYEQAANLQGASADTRSSAAQASLRLRAQPSAREPR
jgi:tetratricopeptide (TPR) repeat protein